MQSDLPKRRGMASEGWKVTHEEWMEKEGIPIYEDIAGVEDITELPRRPWARMGGYGTFILIEGTKAVGRLLYVVEIPGGGALEPEKHLYDELIYILRGRGLSEVWQEEPNKRTFEWGEGSLFTVPTNIWHRLVNGGREPVLFLAVTNAIRVMNTFRNTDFIFNCDYKFTDRYTGRADYFLPTENRYREGASTIWETNFVPDVRTVFLDEHFRKASGGRSTGFRMASGDSMHSSEWPVGRYHKAHHHGPGAILTGLKSVGYVLIWPRSYGIHPFQDGHGDKVIKMNWKPGSIYAPFGEDSFHQHFNTGPEPARQLAFTGVGGPYGWDTLWERDRPQATSVRNGGNLIEYEDEDPEIRRMFQAELRKNGVEFTMPPVVYRSDPFSFPRESPPFRLTSAKK